MDIFRQLKKELLKNRQSAIERGTFKTMENLKGLVLPTFIFTKDFRKIERGKNQRKSPRPSSSERLASAPQEGESCSQCIPVDMKMLRGAWTQVRSFYNPLCHLDVWQSCGAQENFCYNYESESGIFE